MNILGSFFFAFLLIVRLAQLAQSGIDLLGFLLAIQAGLAAFWMIFRRSSSGEAHWSVQLLAWFSAIVPLTMQTSDDAKLVWLSVPGLLLMLWAFWSLGSSFAIAPAARKLVISGPYRFLRHPMYAGELFSLVGFCIGSPLVWNWIVLLVFAFSIWYRISQEESLLKRYAVYAYFVKWHLLPGVW
jgi:isoprenylcysteine carboxyl methyltransferase (ICMT) family protein YpbQ